jgi:iron complex outermembrane receptor protein
MAFRNPLTPIALALATLACQAQDAGPQRITITGRAAPATPEVAGFGSNLDPLATPLAARTITEETLRDHGARAIADLTRLDAGIGEAYNAEGYWSQLTMRGFKLDNRANYRRDGLPINAETALPLDNKERLEVLKGTSGIQAGTSAPGGLVNLVVKRPERSVRAGLVEWRQGGSLLTAVDLGERFGEGERLGLRVNAAHERLDPLLRNARGQRWLLAIAGDVRLPGGALLEAEAEASRQRQPSQPGFSLLGNAVPDARRIDPNLNLNNQPWSLPVVFEGRTASLRFTQPLAGTWRARLHAMTQRLASDDRVAFPFGCTAEGNFDRYCSDGTFDLYDFRSEGERRRSDAVEASLEGRLGMGSAQHHIGAGVLATRFEARLPPQAFNFADIGRIDGSAVVPAAPLPLADVPDRRERSTELFVRDRIQFDGAWRDASLWLGLRHTRLEREANQRFTTPWLALGWRLAPHTHAYASWGQGVETEVAPNLLLYSNAARALPALKSRQTELGLKHANNGLEASLVAFSISRPQTGDAGDCDVDGSCTRVIDGRAVHRGVEAAVAWRDGPWRAQLGALALRARRQGSSNPVVNGLAPTNVPSRSVRAELARSIGEAVELHAALSHEGPRTALPDHSARIPAWTRLDLGAKFEQRWSGKRITWRAAIDNATDRRAWKESPYEFGHAYLYPLPARSVRVSAQFEL